MASLTDRSGRPNSGLVSHPVVGIVTDNVDPNRQGRLRVKFPSLPGEPESWWVRHSSPMGGEERGFYSLPEIGDEVLVAFQQGDQNQGVVIGQFWNGVDIPPAEAEGGMPGSGKTDTGATWSTDVFTDGSSSIDDNDRRFWKSRSGHLFVFDDTSGSETIQIWDGSHTLAFVFDTAKSAIYLTNTTGDIHIRTKNDLYLEAGNDIKTYAGNNFEAECGNDSNLKVGMNYTIDVGTNYKNEAGTNATVKAGTDATLQAGANANVKGGASTGISGPSVSVKGSASTSIQGGMVKIN